MLSAICAKYVGKVPDALSLVKLLKWAKWTIADLGDLGDIDDEAFWIGKLCEAYEDEQRELDREQYKRSRGNSRNHQSR